MSVGGGGTHRDHQVVFGLQLETQREDETLRVLLALTDQEHAAAQTDHRHMKTLQDCSRTYLCRLSESNSMWRTNISTSTSMKSGLISDKPR